jgi:hypothetical protein
VRDHGTLPFATLSSKTEAEHHQRSLTEEDKRIVQSPGTHLAPRLALDRIEHSDRFRAPQTAEILAVELHLAHGTVQLSGVAPAPDICTWYGLNRLSIASIAPYTATWTVAQSSKLTALPCVGPAFMIACATISFQSVIASARAGAVVQPKDMHTKRPVSASNLVDFVAIEACTSGLSRSSTQTERILHLTCFHDLPRNLSIPFFLLFLQRQCVFPAMPAKLLRWSMIRGGFYCSGDPLWVRMSSGDHRFE